MSVATNKVPVTKDFLTTAEVSKKLDVAPVTLKLWRNTSAIDLPYYKFGRSVRYRASDVEAFISNSKR